MSQNRETRRFEIDKPVLRDGKGSLDRYYGQHWVYPIRTTMTASGAEFVVIRRFSDFEKLIELLSKQFPHCILPPIPAKEGAVSNIVTRTTDTGAVVPESRRTAFAMFLKRISFHEVVGPSRILQTFLECDEGSGSTGWNSQAKEGTVRGDSSSSVSWWSYLSSTLAAETVPSEKDAASGFQQAAGEPRVRLTAFQWLCTKIFLRRFSNHVGKVRDALALINENRNEYSRRLGLFSDCLSNALVTGTASEEPFGVRAAMNTIVHSQREVAASVDNHYHASRQVKDVMEYIQLYVESAARTAQYAQHVITTHEEQANVIATLRANHRSCQEANDPSDRIHVLANEIADASEKQRLNEVNAATLDAEVRKELRRFISDLHYDMVGVGSMWRAAQLDECEALKGCWTDLSMKIKGLAPSETERLTDYVSEQAASSAAAAAAPQRKGPSPISRDKTSAPLPPQSPDMM
jgi:hypothetical protein